MLVAGEFEFEALEELPVPLADGGGAAAVLDEIAQARAEADELRAAAHAEGLAAGHEEALAAASPAVHALAAAVAAVHEQGLEAAEQLELRAVELGIAIAEKVLAGAVRAQPELVVEAVRGALRGIVERERIAVLVNPEDLELVRTAMVSLRAELGGIDHCDVQAERRVARGGAVVRHAHGEVDARIETKLERSREIVFDSLAGTEPA
jgi:flagellar biosynthesis/type III secretory pathway protein FliH